jgi:hypothetical protein
MKSHQAASFNASSNEITRFIARYRASGIGLKAFALKEGLPPGRLHYWVYQKSAGVRGRRPTQPTAAVVAPVFQELKLPSRPEWGSGWAAEVGLSGGIAVRFSASASAEWVGSVVQALKRPC